MEKKVGLVLVIMAFLVITSAGLIFSQQDSEPPQEAITMAPQKEPEIQWVWGEVISVDQQKKELLVKYLDYEIDQEKEIKIAADGETTYEGIKSIDEIQPKDTVSIDYGISADGSNVAKNISIEKPESEQPISEQPVSEGQVPQGAAPPTEETEPAPEATVQE